MANGIFQLGVHRLGDGTFELYFEDSIGGKEVTIELDKHGAISVQQFDDEGDGEYIGSHPAMLHDELSKIWAYIQGSQ